MYIQFVNINESSITNKEYDPKTMSFFRRKLKCWVIFEILLESLGNMGGAHAIVTRPKLSQARHASVEVVGWFNKSPRGFLTRQPGVTTQAQYAQHGATVLKFEVPNLHSFFYKSEVKNSSKLLELFRIIRTLRLLRTSLQIFTANLHS